MQVRKAQEQMDTSQLQPGQSVWDTAGKEWTVLDDDPANPNKTLMPADAGISGVPEGTVPTGVKNVLDEEVATQYSLQQDQVNQGVQMAETAPTASKQSIEYKEKIKVDEPYSKETLNNAEDWMRMAPGETNIENWKKLSQAVNWADFIDVVADLQRSIDAKDFQNFTAGAEDLMELIMMNVSMPEDVSPDELEIEKHSRVAQMMDDLVIEDETEAAPDDGIFPYNLDGKNGFVEAMNRITSLREEGLATVDIILKIGEEFDRDTGQNALEEAKYRGIL